MIKKTIWKVLWVISILSIAWLTSLGIVPTAIADGPEDVGFWDNTSVWWYQVPGAAQWTFSDNDDTLLNVIKKAINWVLWILSLIALILCLWWGFQMLTAAWDDNKVKTWTKILKQAAIWLAVIWLSWLLVSFIFRIIDKFTTWV